MTFDEWYAGKSGWDTPAVAVWNAAIDECAKACKDAADDCKRSADASFDLDTRLECLAEQAAFMRAEILIRMRSNAGVKR